MKKFLSLVLALVMTMSLVTVSAGATEYKDFTDKDEIQYEEAVAVLNKLGIITGYSEGDFRPEGELTRGAAAKIIVSLLIGPTAAEALGNETSPYPDVPAGNTFAGVISYCKTANIISGYGDGTFRPTGTLTGYAFSKMLLGALGYKTEYEGFEGAGWNMNVARLGGEAGLFDRISFNGNEPVDRQTACQLALNTLKATEVEYSGGMNITTGDTSMVVKPERNYKVSSNKEINKNIFAGQPMAGGGNEYYTLEFGEEHFVDLKLTHEGDAVDSFGRPSNEWSFKKVTIGTFPIEPDFVYTTQVAHTDATNALKLRELGLGGFTVNYGYTDSNGNPKTEWTEVYVNGMRAECPDEKTFTTTDYYNYPMLDSSDGKSGLVAGIADLTDNGVTVEVYISDDVADWISHVVVTKTQLMEIRSVGSDYVALRGYDNGKSDDANPDKLPSGRDTNGSFPGFNQMAINATLENVQSDDVCYSTLSALKAGDVVAVVPVNSDHNKIGESGAEFYVADAYVPETVSGALTAVKDYGSASDKKAATNVTVGGTSYDVALWNKDLFNVTADIIKATKKDVTLYLDRNGNALLAKDIGATNDFMVVGAWRSAIENGRIVDIVTGWDISGNAIELNLGPNGHDDHKGVMPGDLVRYSSNSSNVAEWNISETTNSGVYDVFTGVDTNGTTDLYKIKSSNVYIAVNNGTADAQVAETVTIDKNIKFIYVNYSEDDHEVESVEVKEGVQNVENTELDHRCENQANYNIAQAGVKDNAVKVVVIKGESNDAIATNMLYVTKFVGGAGYDSTGKMVYEYRVAMNSTGNRLVDDEDEKAIFSYDRLERGDFASYTAVENADHSEFYSLRRHNNFVKRTTATYSARIWDIVSENKGLVALDEYTWVNGPVLNEAEPGISGDKTVELSQPHKSNLGVGNEQNIASIKGAAFVDIRSASAKKSTGEITNWDDLKDVMMPNGSAVCTNTLDVHLIINDNPDNDGFRTAAMVVVYGHNGNGPAATRFSLNSAVIKGFEVPDDDIPDAGGTYTTPSQAISEVKAGDADIESTFTFSGAKATLTYDNGTAIESTNGVLKHTGAIAAGKSFVIKVWSYNDVGNVAPSGTYTFTIGALEPAPDGSYKNTTALGYADKVTAGNGFVENDWKFALEDADTKITLTGAAFSFPFLNTGNDAETMAQLKEAVEYWNEWMDGDPELGEPSKKRDGSYVIPIVGENDNATFDPATVGTKVYIVVEDTGKIENATQTVTGLSLSNSTGLAAGVTVNNVMAPAADGSAKVIPGGTYEKDKYAEVGAKLTTVTTGASWSVDYVYETGATGTSNSKGWVEIGSEVKVVFTATADIDLGSATTPKLAIATVDADAAAEYDKAGGGTATLDTTNSDKKNTVFTASTGKIAKNDTVTYTYTIDTTTSVLDNGVFKLTSATWTTGP